MSAFLPTPPQELLLRACLLGGGEAGEAWDAWRRADALERADSPSQRLFPLLFRRLEAAGWRGGELPRLEGIYRHRWFAAAGHGERARRAIEDLEAAGCKPLAHGPTAVALGVWGDLGVRVTTAADVLVPADRAAAARAEAGPGVRVHARLTALPADDAGVWERSVPFPAAGAAARAPCPADLLLWALLSGLGHQRDPATVWLADAHALIGAGGVDWETLVAEAERRRVTLAVAAGLRYLAERLAAPVPGDVPTRLAAAGPGPTESATMRIAARTTGPRLTLRLIRDRHQRLRDLGARPGPLPLFAWRELALLTR